jgi:mRNA interferase MazF
MAFPLRGEIWTIDLNPTRGHERAGKRPALIVSDDVFNAGPAGLVIVLPLTTKSKGVRSHVPVQPPEGGLRKPSFIKCEDVRSAVVERLGHRMGAVAPATLEAVAMRLRILMDL